MTIDFIQATINQTTIIMTFEIFVTVKDKPLYAVSKPCTLLQIGYVCEEKSPCTCGMTCIDACTTPGYECQDTGTGMLQVTYFILLSKYMLKCYLYFREQLM